MSWQCCCCFLFIWHMLSSLLKGPVCNFSSYYQNHLLTFDFCIQYYYYHVVCLLKLNFLDIKSTKTCYVNFSGWLIKTVEYKISVKDRYQAETQTQRVKSRGKLSGELSKTHGKGKKVDAGAAWAIACRIWVETKWRWHETTKWLRRIATGEKS